MYIGPQERRSVFCFRFYFTFTASPRQNGSQEFYHSVDSALKSQPSARHRPWTMEVGEYKVTSKRKGLRHLNNSGLATLTLTGLATRRLSLWFGDSATLTLKLSLSVQPPLAVPLYTSRGSFHHARRKPVNVPVSLIMSSGWYWSMYTCTCTASGGLDGGWLDGGLDGRTDGGRLDGRMVRMDTRVPFRYDIQSIISEFLVHTAALALSQVCERHSRPIVIYILRLCSSHQGGPSPKKGRILKCPSLVRPRLQQGGTDEAHLS